MIFIFDNGEVFSNHVLYFVEAPDDFGAWFNDVYRPWVDGIEYRPLMIVATAPAVERCERIPYNSRPADALDLPIEEFLAHVVTESGQTIYERILLAADNGQRLLPAIEERR